MVRAGRSRRFRSDRELAEAATTGVCMMLDLDEPYIATVVQPVASAAWRVVLEGRGARELEREAKRARLRLRAACRSEPAVAFLEAVIRHARSRGHA